MRLPRLCEVCISEQEQEKAQEAERDRNRALWSRWRAICPPLYQDTDPARLSQTILARLLAWQYGPKGILITGPSGEGKTRCLFELLRRLLREGRSIEAFDAVQFGHECARRFQDQDAADTWLRYLVSVDIVFFDDFGKERLTDRSEAEMFGLLERRTARHKPTFFTTNYTGQMILSRMSEDRGAPFLRRLLEFCECITIVDGQAIESR